MSALEDGVLDDGPLVEPSQLIDLDGLDIAFDDTVLRPRPWTLAQSHWAAELLPMLPEGPVLEVCAGVGHIGLAAVAGSDRDLVLADASERACSFARRNADAVRRSGSVEVRRARVEDLPHGHERFALLLADPPWVRTAEVDRFPADPRFAIDGGDDGLAVALECLDLAARSLVPGGAAILQLGTSEQAVSVARRLHDQDGPLHVREVRSHEPDGVLVLLA